MKTHNFFSLSKLVLGLAFVLGAEQMVFADTLPAPVPNAVVSATSAWGTAQDSWAGYTGNLSVWVPNDITGGWVLTFQSAGLGSQAVASSFWNAAATYNQSTNTFTITSSEWGKNVPANTVLDIGFNANGVLGTSTALSNCKLNGQPCVISVMSSAVSKLTMNNLKTNYQGGTTSVTPPPPVPPDNTGTTVNPPATNANAALQLEFAVNSSWSGGYSGLVSIKNLSTTSLPAGVNGWKAVLKFPDVATAKDVFKDGPWNFVVAFANDGITTLTPQSWSAAIAPGNNSVSGFNGGNPANLQKVASGNQFVSVVFGSSIPNPPTTGTPTPPVIDPGTTTPPVTTNPQPTGNSNGFVLSPYKDVTINMNWNTNVISTDISGNASPLLTVMPAKLNAVTWAFATGECGSENWGGLNPDNLATANLQKFVNANINYIISTGGAAGAFTCSTETGMRKFINRYASLNLIGIDFDIEAGQNKTEIENIVKQAVAVEADYPKLRFSFTLATMGSSNGTAATSPYGDLNATGDNTIKAIKQFGLVNYTINLMVMDYGSAAAYACVPENGACNMGKTAIQAAKNLNAKYGIPFSKIELTPMIGMNDVVKEIFSLQDVDTMSQWVASNGLAGVHFWSVDRDKPCSLANASATCSSVTNVPAWGYSNRFLTDLGF